MVNFSAGITALQANQTALGVVGHNIANANTPGFSRREALFSENASVNIGGLFIGQGVSIDLIRRTQNEAAKESLLGILSDGSGTELQLANAQQLEAILAPGNGSLLDRFETFFNELERLSAFPDNNALRTTVVESADSMAAEIRRVADRLHNFVGDLDTRIQEVANAVSSKANEIAKLNAEMARVSRNGEAQDLQDRRDVAIQELSKLVNISLEPQSGGDVEVVIGGAIPIAADDLNLITTLHPDGTLEIRHPLCEDGLRITGGELGGLLSARNDTVAVFQKRLDGMVEALVSEFDTAHSVGVGIRSSHTQLTSQRQIPSLDVPMGLMDLALPIQAGELFINMTDPSGNVTAHRIEISPATQTVRDVGDLLSSIDGIQAFTPIGGGTFGIIAESGYSFDFTGRVPEQPVNSNLNGTTQVRLEGRHTESVNDQYRFRFLNDGVVGNTQPLQIEVTNSQGHLVTLLDAGERYEPGTPLAVVPGVNVLIDEGTVVADDSFEAYVVGEPDTSGFLAATGLNTFFIGSSARTIEVNAALLEDPSLMATTTTGNPSDTTNLQRMVAVRDKQVFGSGSQTLEQYVTDIIAEVALEVSDLEQIATNNADLRDVVEAQIEASSGVDINEEIARMLQYQRSMQAAAQYISTLNDIVAELTAILR